MQDKVEPRWLTVKATAAYLGVSSSGVYRLRKEGVLPKPNYYLGPHSPRYDREALDAMFGVAGTTTMEQAIQEAINGGALNTRRQTQNKRRNDKGILLQTEARKAQTGRSR